MRYLTNGGGNGSGNGAKDPTGPAIDARKSTAAEALDALESDQPKEIQVSDTDDQIDDELREDMPGDPPPR